MLVKAGPALELRLKRKTVRPFWFPSKPPPIPPLWKSMKSFGRNEAAPR